MDFFARQDTARAASRRLVILFVVAVAGLLLVVNLLAAWAVDRADAYLHTGHPHWTHLLVTLGTLAIIGVGSWMKTSELIGGGPALAVLLGGREALPVTADAGELRLRNVVEEMAIAAGIPVPAVFVLDSAGINAFAAGHGLGDTAIAVTRGCLDHLSRDELQAVIGHETSHLLNGDARLNLRLMGGVHGLLAISHTGKAIVRFGWETEDARAVMAFTAIGGIMIGIGGVGWLMASLVHAGVSRQREFLADAAAVQFTRNAPAVAAALKKACDPAIGSRVAHPQAVLASHLFFTRPDDGWLSTHPPLAERIRRVEPGWDGTFAPAGRGAETPAAQAPMVSRRQGSALPGPEQVDYASQLLTRLPEMLTAAAGEAYGARAVVLAMVLGDEARLGRIRATDAPLAALTAGLLPVWRPLDADRARLPLLHLALPALRRLSPTQRDGFLALLDETVRGGTVGAQLAARLVRVHLAGRPRAADFHAMRPLIGDATVILAGLAAASPRPLESFTAGWTRLLLPGPMRDPIPADPGPEAIGVALDRLARANAAIRRRVVEAAAHAIAADGVVAPREAELLRLVCESLALPLPLFRDR